MPNRIRSVVAFLTLALLIAVQQAGGQDKAKDKDAKDKKEPDKGVAFKVVKVDKDKKTAVIRSADGKLQTIKIGDDIQFIGPRGGVSKEGIADDRFAPGAEIRIVYDKTGKMIKEIYLPLRKTDKDSKDKDGKDKDKAKDKDNKDKDKAKDK